MPLPKQTAIMGPNDYWPVALTLIAMKCLERLVLKNIKAALPNTADPHQFAHRPNRSTDIVSTALHTVLLYLEKNKNICTVVICGFNTILPSRLFHKMSNLCIPHNICLWIQDFLTNRLQSVMMGPRYSSSLSFSTGAPQGCILSPFLYSLYIHDCTHAHSTNVIIKFADDTTVVGLISEGEETAYREAVRRLTEWCAINNLTLNKKTKKMMIDFRRKKNDHQPLTIR